MLAYKQMILLFSDGLNRVTAPEMSKISCKAARKHDLSCGFANDGGGVLNRYVVKMYKVREETEYEITGNGWNCVCK